MDPENNGYYKVVWKGTETDISIKGGSLLALIDIRDKILRDNINNINAFAVNLVDLVNEVHRDGFGRNGKTNIDFFQYINISDNVEGNHDLNNDGIDDVTAIYKVSGSSQN